MFYKNNYTCNDCMYCRNVIKDVYACTASMTIEGLDSPEKVDPACDACENLELLDKQENEWWFERTCNDCIYCKSVVDDVYACTQDLIYGGFNCFRPTHPESKACEEMELITNKN